MLRRHRPGGLRARHRHVRHRARARRRWRCRCRATCTIHHRRVSAKAIRDVRQRSSPRWRLDERLKLPGLDARRADLIVPGAVLLDTILRQLGAEELTLCELSLREGAVLDYIRRNRVHIERVERYPDVRRRSVDRAGPALQLRGRPRRAGRAPGARDLRPDAPGARARRPRPRVARLRRPPARRRRAHQLRAPSPPFVLPGEERRSPRVRAGRDRGAWRSSPATTARGAPRKGHDAFADLPRASREAVRWLSAMLRVAESLDRSRAQLVERVTLRRRGRHWTLRVAGRGDIELELWAAQRNAAAARSRARRNVTVAAGRAGGVTPRATLPPLRREPAAAPSMPGRAGGGAGLRAGATRDRQQPRQPYSSRARRGGRHRGVRARRRSAADPPAFDGGRAMEHLRAVVGFGPRPPGSAAAEETRRLHQGADGRDRRAGGRAGVRGEDAHGPGEDGERARHDSRRPPGAHHHRRPLRHEALPRSSGSSAPTTRARARRS